MGVNIVNQDSFTLGSGILSIDKNLTGSYENIGLLLNDVTFTYTVELLKLEAGTPTVLVTQAKASEGVTLAFEVAEITATTIQTAMGVSDSQVTTVAGTEVNVLDQEISFASGVSVYGTGHENISNVVLSTAAAGGGSNLVAGDDYYADLATGIIYRIGAGAIVDDTTYYLDYDYTPPASKTLSMGGAVGGLPTVGLKFEHTRPTGEKITIYIWRAQTNGTATLTFSDGAYNTIPMTFDGLADTSKAAGNQLASIVIETV